MPTIVYLSGKNTILPERNDEFEDILTKSTGSIEFTHLIKKAMVKAKKSIIYRTKSFFETIRDKKCYWKIDIIITIFA